MEVKIILVARVSGDESIFLMGDVVVRRQRGQLRFGSRGGGREAWVMWRLVRGKVGTKGCYAFRKMLAGS